MPEIVIMAPIKLTGFNYFLIGSNMVGLMVLSIGLGLWLDHKFSSKPWFLLGGIGLGLSAVAFLFWRLIALTKKMSKKGK